MTHDHEIWFRRWLWSYTPCHWKGCAVLVGFSVAILDAIWLSLWAVSALGHPEWDVVALFPLILGLVALWIVTERHSA